MSQNLEHFIQYFFGLNLVFKQLFLKTLTGMANSVDPDQLFQEQSDLGLHCLHMPFCKKQCTKV